jgi:hypothetical protein
MLILVVTKMSYTRQNVERNRKAELVRGKRCYWYMVVLGI